MLFSIGNLVTLAITLVLFAIYHQLTANNRSLEKVKRLSEKLQNELKEFVSQRSEEIQHYGIDLEVQQKAAKIALEKLQGAQETVAEKAQTVGAIADRFKEYDEALAKLMDMTARVDENLKRIHEDEAFAEGVNRKLDLARKSLGAIEREMPLLRESFAQEAQRTIESFRDSVMDQLQEALDTAMSAMSAAKEEASSATARAVEANEQIEARFSQAFESASDRAKSLEDEAFTRLVAASKERMEALAADTSRALAQAGRETAAQVAELREALAAFRETWNAEAESRLSAVSERLAETETSLDKKTKDAETSIAGTLSSARTELANLKSELAAISSSLAEKSAALESDFQARENTLTQSLSSTKDRIEEDFAAFGQAFEDHRTRFEANFNAEVASLRKSLEQMAKEMSELKSKAYENASIRLADFEDSLSSELEERKAAAYQTLDSWLGNLEKTFSGVASSRAAANEENGTPSI